MQRVLSLSADNKKRFQLLWEGFTTGALMERHKTQQQGQSRDDRKSETRIKRALSAVSEAPDGEAPDVDARPRVLRSGGGDVRLDQADFTRLTRYVGQTPWSVHVVEQASELEDWLEAAPQAKDE